MNKINIIILLILSIIFSQSALSMITGRDADSYKKKELVKNLLAASQDSNHPFSVTMLWRYDINDDFDSPGDLSQGNQQDLINFNNGWWIYVPEFTEQTTRLSKETSQKIGALIIGGFLSREDAQKRANEIRSYHKDNEIWQKETWPKVKALQEKFRHPKQ